MSAASVHPERIDGEEPGTSILARIAEQIVHAAVKTESTETRSAC